MSFIKRMITGPDNQTEDVSRVAFAAFALAFLVFQGFALFKGQVWDGQAFAIGAGAILALGGAGVGVKAHAEPRPRGGVPTGDDDPSGQNSMLGQASDK